MFRNVMQWCVDRMLDVVCICFPRSSIVQNIAFRCGIAKGLNEAIAKERAGNSKPEDSK